MQILKLLAVPFFCLSASTANAADTPLFDAFKKFCIDTRAEPDAIRKAAEAAGGKIRPPPAIDPSTAATAAAPGVELELLKGRWSVLLPAGMFEVSASGLDHGATDACDVKGPGDDESMAALCAWLPAPASYHSPNAAVFDFVMTDDARTPLPSDEAALSAAHAEGRAWAIGTLTIGREMIFNVLHTLPAKR